jgi:Na+-transporting NADH:ubiquinone oxidoreductase subunit B
MKQYFDRQRARYAQTRKRSLTRALFETLDGFLFSTATTTSAAPHVRDTNSVQRLLNNFVIASLPAWAIGMWSVGRQINRALEMLSLDGAEGWRADLLRSLGFGFDPFSIADCFLHGLLYFLPVFVTALIVGTIWESLFARYRERPVDDGLLWVAWLFSLFLPATVPLLAVAFGMTVAVVLGKAIFGGVGRYLVSPPVLGVAFLIFSYANVVLGHGAWVPVAGYDDPTTIELFTDEGGIPVLLSVGYTWWGMFFGDQPGSMGVTSLFACMLGAIYLLVSGSASWRIMLGSVLGLVLTSYLFNALGGDHYAIAQVPWHWHVLTGGWAFATVFLATDPVAAAYTNTGRWAYGLTIGVLTIIIRVTNPGYYEGVIFAVLLASVFAPLFDYVVVQRNIRRRLRRLQEFA